jgi:hypothetical protein
LPFSFIFDFLFLNFETYSTIEGSFPAWGTGQVCIFPLISPSLCCCASRHDADMNKRTRKRFHEADTYMCFSASLLWSGPWPHKTILTWPHLYVSISLSPKYGREQGNRKKGQRVHEARGRQERRNSHTFPQDVKGRIRQAQKLDTQNRCVCICLSHSVCVCVCARARDSQISFPLTHAQKPEIMLSLSYFSHAYHNCISILTHLSTYFPIFLFLY